ncbi:MAG: uroporphyrinogen-III synthase [Myxococcales bacterium]
MTTGPLSGKRVLVTRAEAQAGELAGRLRALGAELLFLPGLEILPPESWDSLDGALAELGRFDWIAFTSQNAIAPLWERLAVRGLEASALSSLRVAAVGARTAAALASRGVKVQVVPEEHTAAALAALLAPEVRGRRLLWPRAERASEPFAESLRAAGALEVRPAVCYRVRTPGADAAPIRAAMAEGAIAAVTLGSPRTLEGVLELLGPAGASWLGRCALVCIGPTTAAACRERGLAPIVADPHTAAGVAEAVRAALS